jgi:hypothetical protein
VLTARLRDQQNADLKRAEDHVCSCGWITARAICLMCDGVRTDGDA